MDKKKQKMEFHRLTLRVPVELYQFVEAFAYSARKPMNVVINDLLLFATQRLVEEAKKKKLDSIPKNLGSEERMKYHKAELDALRAKQDFYDKRFNEWKAMVDIFGPLQDAMLQRLEPGDYEKIMDALEKYSAWSSKGDEKW